MIEVEKKFLLAADDEARLLEDAEFIAEKTITDSYYDNAAYGLSRKDWWLRSRNGQFELKVPLKAHKFDSATRQYHELETDAEIREALGLGAGEGLAQDLVRTGYDVFCECTTTRRKYTKDGFALDLDDVTFKGTSFEYTLAEIELLVEDASGVQQAEDAIMNFAHQHELTTDAVVMGKVIAYLKEVNPDHYSALQTDGVIA